MDADSPRWLALTDPGSLVAVVVVPVVILLVSRGCHTSGYEIAEAEIVSFSGKRVGSAQVGTKKWEIKDAVIEYAYEVDGTHYTGETVYASNVHPKLSRTVSGGNREFRRLAEAYQVGDRVDAHYRPDDPGDAYLEDHVVPDVGSMALMGFIAGLLSMAAIVALMVGLMYVGSRGAARAFGIYWVVMWAPFMVIIVRPIITNPELILMGIGAAGDVLLRGKFERLGCAIAYIPVAFFAVFFYPICMGVTLVWAVPLATAILLFIRTAYLFFVPAVGREIAGVIEGTRKPLLARLLSGATPAEPS